MICPKCKRDLMPRLSPSKRAKELRNHEGSRGCTLDALAQELFARDLVPYPKGHSLPNFIPIQVYKTRAETGLDKLGQLMPRRSSSFEDQFWAPKRARIVTEQVEREEQDALVSVAALGDRKAVRVFILEIAKRRRKDLA